MQNDIVNSRLEIITSPDPRREFPYPGSHAPPTIEMTDVICDNSNSAPADQSLTKRLSLIGFFHLHFHCDYRLDRLLWIGDLADLALTNLTEHARRTAAPIWNGPMTSRPDWQRATDPLNIQMLLHHDDDKTTGPFDKKDRRHQPVVQAICKFGTTCTPASFSETANSIQNGR